MIISMMRTALGILTMLVALLLLPAGASAQKVLRYTDHEPFGGMRTAFIRDVFFAAIERESNGRLKIEPHWDSTVATGYRALGVVGEGREADIGVVVPEYTDKALPLHQIFKSFPRGPAGAAQVAFWRRVFDEVPAFSTELARNNAVSVLAATGYPVAFFSTRALHTLDDIRGQKWRTASFWHTEFLRNAGAEPVSMPWGQGVFDALKTRSLDGLMVNIDSGQMLRVHDVARQVVASRELWLGHVYLVAMNRDVWSLLAQEDKAAIARAAEIAYRQLGSIMDRSFDAMVEELKGAGVQIRQLETTESRAFEVASGYQRVQANWVKSQQAAGVSDIEDTMTKVRVILADAMR